MLGKKSSPTKQVRQEESSALGTIAAEPNANKEFFGLDVDPVGLMTDPERSVAKDIGMMKNYEITITIPIKMSVPVELNMSGLNVEEATAAAQKLLTLISEIEILRMAKQSIADSMYRCHVTLDDEREIKCNSDKGGSTIGTFKTIPYPSSGVVTTSSSPTGFTWTTTP